MVCSEVLDGASTHRAIMMTMTITKTNRCMKADGSIDSRLIDSPHARDDKSAVYGNRHRGTDQWLFVVSGVGDAVIEDKHAQLRAGTLLLIQRGETHEIRNTGTEVLKTLSIYVPPGYTEDGDELPAGKA
jgi:mannose-6-phosphate isomerase-like protein (cupin superfamily)